MLAIEVENLHFTYPSRDVPTLRGINLTVRPGEFVLLTGPTGCGKSTLMRSLNGLLPQTSGQGLSGRIRINSVDVAEQPLAVTCQQVGLLFQNPDDQLFCILVEDEIAFGLENLGVPAPEIDRRIDLALAQVGLIGFRHRPIASLSGGQKQRIALACLCAMQPRVLLLDEPTSHLDPQGTRDILDIIRRLNKEVGITVITATHDVSEIAPLCHRVLLMDDGELVSDLPIDLAFRDLEPYRRLGVQVPKLAQIAEDLGYSQRPLTLQSAVQLFGNGRMNDGTKSQKGRLFLESYVSKGVESTSSHPAFHVSRLTQDAPSNEVLIDARDVTFRYPRTSVHVLKQISFQVKRGEVIAVMGANGSGKTTLLLHLVALLRPSSGTVFIKGRDTKRYKPHQLAGKVGIVFQNPDLLLQASTVYDEVAFGPTNLKLPRHAVRNRVDEILPTFDLADLKAEAPYALSRGQRQRAAVAANLSLYPDLLLLDEPTTGQDHYHLQQLMGMLCHVMKAQKKTIIFCTHDIQLTLEYANRILLLHHGELILDGPPAAIFGAPERLKRASLVPPLTMQLRLAIEKRESANQ